MERKTKNHHHRIAPGDVSEKTNERNGTGRIKTVFSVIAWGMTAVIASVHLGCLVWQKAKLRDKRDDRVTHSRRMGKPTAPLTPYFSERGGHRAQVSSYLCCFFFFPFFFYRYELLLTSCWLIITHRRRTIASHKIHRKIWVNFQLCHQICVLFGIISKLNHQNCITYTLWSCFNSL